MLGYGVSGDARMRAKCAHLVYSFLGNREECQLALKGLSLDLQIWLTGAAVWGQLEECPLLLYVSRILTTLA